MSRSTFLSAVAFSTLLAACGSASAGVIFSDTLDSNTGWVNNQSGAAVTVATTTFQPSVGSGSGWTTGTTAPAAITGLTAFQLNNISVRRDIGQTVTTDWTLNVKFLSTSYARTQEMAFTDSNGNGYAVAVDAGNPTQYGTPVPGKGAVWIRKTSAWAGAAASYVNGTNLGVLSNGTHWVTGYAIVQPATNPLVFDTSVPWTGYADIKLSWTAATGELKVWEDDVLVATRTDTSYVPGVAGFTGFSRIVLGGNTSGSYDSVSVSLVPEPTMLAPLALGATMMLARRRKAAAC